MKKKKILVCILIIIAIISFRVVAFAEVETSEYSQRYLEWLALPEEEREKTIAPLPYNIRAKSKKGIFSGIKRTVKSIQIPDSYILLKQEDTNIKVDKYGGIDIERKDQMQTGECWAFSALSTVETNLALNKNEKYSFSERHMEYNTSNSFYEGQVNEWALNRRAGSGGTSTTAFTYLSRGTGPILEEDMPFENNESPIDINTMPQTGAVKQVGNMKYFPSIYKQIKSEEIVYCDANYNEYTKAEVDDMRIKIKEHIMKNGGIVTAISAPQDNWFYNPDTFAENNNQISSTNHDVTIIGWDDEFSKDNFLNKPSEDGAYIVLNSWGRQWGNDDIYYISYEDLMVESSLRGVSDVEDLNYDYIYQHDISEIYEYALVEYAANVFESKQDEVLKQVMISSPDVQNCNIYLNNGDLNIENSTLISKNVKLDYGYNTINLEKTYDLQEGQKFAIIVELLDDYVGIGLESNGVGFANATINPGESYVFFEDNWEDVADTEETYNLSIKALTSFKEDRLEVSNVTGKAYTGYGGDFSVGITTTTMNNGKDININIYKDEVNETNKFTILGNKIAGKAATVRFSCSNDITQGVYEIEIEIDGKESVRKEFEVLSAEGTIEIEFNDINFLKAMAGKVEDSCAILNEKKLITSQEKIDQINWLNLSDCRIEDITGIEKFKNIQVLILSGNKIKNIELLNHLTKVNYLYLSSTGLTNNDIEKLSIFENLTELDFSYNKINDLNFVTKNKSENLSLRLTCSAPEEPIDISPIFENNNLYSLDMTAWKWLDETCLEGIQTNENLKELILIDCGLKDLEILRSLNLRLLWINNDFYNEHTFNSLEPIAHMSSLENLNISGNPNIKSLDELKDIIDNLSFFMCREGALEDANILDLVNDESLKLFELQSNNIYRYNYQYKNGSIVELPAILKQACDSNSKVYSENGLELENCQWNEEGKSIRLNSSWAIVTIKSGIAEETKLKINIYDNNHDRETVTLTIPDQGLFSCLLENLYTIEADINKQTITTYKSIVEQMQIIELNKSYIRDLTGISQFPNLKKVIFNQNYMIENIEDLANLEYLEEVEIGNTNIENVDCLLEKFENLRIIGNDNRIAPQVEDKIELPKYMYDILISDESAEKEINIFYDINEIKEEYQYYSMYHYEIDDNSTKGSSELIIDEEKQKAFIKADNLLSQERNTKIRAINLVINSGKYLGTEYTSYYTVNNVFVYKEPYKVEYIEGDNFNPTGLEIKVLNDNGEYEDAKSMNVLNGENLKFADYMPTEIQIEVNDNPELIAKVDIWVFRKEDLEEIQFQDKNFYQAVIDGDAFKEVPDIEYMHNSIVMAKDDETLTIWGLDEVIWNIGAINLSGKNITDLHGIERFGAIESINLSNNKELEGVSPLENNNWLKEIDISNTKVENLNDLLQNNKRDTLKIIKNDDEVIDGNEGTIELPNYLYHIVSNEEKNYEANIYCDISKIDNKYSINYENEKIEAIVKKDNGRIYIEVDNQLNGQENLKINAIELKISSGKYIASKYRIFYEVERKLDSIEIEDLPIKLEYIEGQNFDVEGLVIGARYNHGEAKEITNYVIENGENLQVGQTEIIIKYTEEGITKEAKLEITVVPKIIDSIEFIGYEEVKEENISYLKNILSNTSYEKFLENINTQGEIQLYDKENQLVIDESTIIKTGKTLKIIISEEEFEYKLVVKGDCNGSGTCNVSDLTTLMMSIAESLAIEKKDESKILKNEYAMAVDFNNSNSLNVVDLTQLRMLIAESK